MPSYNALGVKATLSVTPLADTLNNDIVYRMGQDQQREADRISSLLCNGRKLPECPIGTDGISKVGVMQFIGENEDLAMFMVEAGDRLEGWATAAVVPSFRTLDGLKNASSALANVDSPHSEGSFMTAPETQSRNPTLQTERDLDEPHDSIDLDEATTHALDEPHNSIGWANKANAKQVKHDSFITPKKSVKPFTFGLQSEVPSTPAPVWSAFATPRDPLALTLTLEYSGRTFLRRDRNLVGTGKDLKIEILVNGQLAVVEFRAARKSGLEIQTQPFSGMRLHRQSEKPWVYDQKTNPGFLDAAAAKQRWDSISNALSQEADARGADFAIQRPLTGEYLMALSQLPLPQRVGTKGASFGIIDVMITAGKGRKYGPETTYQRIPTRMDNKTFKATNIRPAAVPHLDPLLQQGDDVFTNIYGDANSEAPSAPYSMRSHVDNQAPDTPVATPERPKMLRNSEIYREVLRTNSFKQMVGAYPNAHGRPGSQRTLKQRLGDIIKMSPTKRREAYAELQTKLDEDTLRKVKRALEIKDDELTDTPSKRVQPEPEQIASNAGPTEALGMGKDEFARNTPSRKLSFQTELDAFTTEAFEAGDLELTEGTPTKKVRFAPETPSHQNAFLADGDEKVLEASNDNTVQGSIDPRLLALSPDNERVLKSRDQAAMLTQGRMDMALEYGLGSNGALLNHMASTSPQRVPIRSTPASSLTGAPCDVPVKKRTYTPTGSARVRQPNAIVDNPEAAPPARKKRKYNRKVRASAPVSEAGPELSASLEPLSLDPVLSTMRREDSPYLESAKSAIEKRAATSKAMLSEAAPGANRNRRRWNPHEETPEAALEGFEIPDLCVGSAVTYAGRGMQRQIKKERNGEFTEEVFIVGMRFVVS